ncbi:hypothetical protein BCR44DRAFT_40083 [Catenaria anguillulae PL171]|uniref:Uncharacterized protein n=1 Tax=Catenaria anguillulae PL171 TaxID=765915 RepID=A0A1Y2H7I4_9FUNG|nr:hypothetical protein BCR44DRAFT_40083 [Catenaria anguillulae PL171]
MLWKRPISNAFVTLVVIVTLFLVDLAFLFSWTYLAPLQPAVQSSATHFSYTCQSANSPLTHSLLTATHVAWNLLLVWSLGFFTNATRWLRTPARSQHYTHFVAVNYALCAGVGILAAVLLRFASFALAMFWIYTLLVWYIVAYTLAMLHVCVLQQVKQGPRDEAAGVLADAADPLYALLEQRYASRGGNEGAGTAALKSFAASDLNRAGFAGSVATAGSAAGAGPGRPAHGTLWPLPGKSLTLVGDFAIKFPRVFSTWTLHRMVIALDEGYLGVVRKPGGVEEKDVGHVWRLGDLSSRFVPYLDCVLEVRLAGDPIMFVQLNDELQAEEMVRFIPDRMM